MDAGCATAAANREAPAKVPSSTPHLWKIMDTMRWRVDAQLLQQLIHIGVAPFHEMSTAARGVHVFFHL